jgi:hypothetical protein
MTSPAGSLDPFYDPDLDDEEDEDEDDLPLILPYTAFLVYSRSQSLIA